MGRKKPLGREFILIIMEGSMNKALNLSEFRSQMQPSRGAKLLS